MKKLVAFAAVIAATTEETAVAEGDSTAVEAPAAETEAAPAE